MEKCEVFGRSMVFVTNVMQQQESLSLDAVTSTKIKDFFKDKEIKLSHSGTNNFSNMVCSHYTITNISKTIHKSLKCYQMLR